MSESNRRERSDLHLTKKLWERHLAEITFVIGLKHANVYFIGRYTLENHHSDLMLEPYMLNPFYIWFSMTSLWWVPSKLQ